MVPDEGDGDLSVISPTEVVAMSEISDRLLEYSNSYTASTITSRTKATIEALNRTKILSDHLKSGARTEDDIGRSIYEGVIYAATQAGDLFKTVIEQNYDLQGEMERINHTHATDDAEYQRVSVVSQLQYVEPKESLFTLRGTHAFRNFKGLVAQYATDRTSREGGSSSATRSSRAGRRGRTGEQDMSADARGDAGSAMTFSPEDRAEAEEISQLPAEERTRRLDDKQETIALAFSMEYNEEYVRYKAKADEKNDAIQKKVALEQKTQKQKVLMQVVQMFILLKDSLATKLMTTLEPFTGIVDQLKATVVINGEEVTNPYEGRNLSGMVYALKRKFYRRTFVAFSESLLDLMDFKFTAEEANNNPESALIRLEGKYAKWKRLKLWSMMTEDVLFTLLIVRGIPSDSKFRENVVDELRKLVRELRIDDSSAESSAASAASSEPMALFNRLKEYIRDHQDFKRVPGGQKERSNRSTKVDGGRQGSSEKGLENAAQAQEHKESDTSSGSSGSTSQTKEKFAGEVFASDKRKIQVPSRKGKIWVSYIAVKSKHSICDKCYGLDGSEQAPCGKREDSQRCRALTCHKCGYLGHMSPNCLQQFKLDGSPIS